MASPPPGYDRPTGTLGRSGRGARAVVIAFVIFVAAVMLKPWGGTTATVPPVTPTTRAAAIADVPVVSASPSPPATPAPTPPWPAARGAISGQTATAGTVMDLAESGYPSGAWGIWIAGDGPRLDRDVAWRDWTEVKPEPSSDAPSHVATWPDTDVCAGLPTLFGLPLAVSVTTPGGPLSGRIDAWWTDGTHVASLSGSVGYLTIPRTDAAVASGVAGAPLLIRIDGATWPAGRYELHVARGGSTFALTYCLEPTTV